MDGIQEAQAIQDRVAAGAAWLDEHKPEWVECIEPLEINITNCNTCVLGQVFRDAAHGDGTFRSGFGYVIDELVPPPVPGEISWSVLHGFAPGGTADDYVSAVALEDEWRRVIVERSA